MLTLRQGAPNNKRESMKDKINAVIAKVSPQTLCAESIGWKHELASIGFDAHKQMDLVDELEETVKQPCGKRIYVPDEIGQGWRVVGDVYSFYGVA